MRLEQLEYLVAVAESGSFRTAAQKLNIARPAVSVALKSLEDELGETLFIKESRGIRLTPLGHLAVEKAGGALELINELRAASGNSAGEKAFSVDTQRSLLFHLTGNIIAPFGKLHPRIRISARSVYIADVIKELKSGCSRITVTLDGRNANVLEAARDMGCEVTPLSVVERRIFLGAGHPLAAKDALTPEDLKTICIAYYSGSLSHLTGHYSPHFAGEYRLANREDVLDLVVRNEAAVILPGSLFRHDERVRKGELVEKAIPLPGMEHTAPITAIRLPELSFAERLFWDYLIENFAGSL